MNLNKEFLSEVISYLINRGVTLTDVLDTFNEHFNTLDAFTNDVKERVTVTESVTESPYKLVVTPLTPLSQKTEPKNVSLKDASLSPNFRPYPTSIEPHGKGVSKARKMLFEVVGDKTVLEHLKANNIGYKLFDTRIRKNWSMEKACTTPLTKVVKPYTRAKKPTETPKQEPVIIPDNVKVVEESSPKTKMMLVNGRMTEMKVSDTDLVQSSIIEKPEKTIETESNAENPKESVTIEPQTKSDTDTRENNADAYSDAICEELHETNTDKIEQMTDQAVRDIVTGKNKEKKKPENKKDYAVSDLCFKLNITTHELREMVNSGEFPQPDRGNKWSAKLLKGKLL